MTLCCIYLAVLGPVAPVQEAVIVIETKIKRKSHADRAICHTNLNQSTERNVPRVCLMIACPSVLPAWRGGFFMNIHIGFLRNGHIVQFSLCVS